MTAIREIYPLAPLQEGLLFQSLSDPASRAYFVQLQYELSEPLDVHAFTRAWRLLFRRHDILRTAFFHENVTRPLQVVFKEREPEIVIIDDVAEYARRDRERGFDLQREPLMRFGIAERQLVWSYHHILLDGWCLGILQRELAAAYEAYRNLCEPLLPPVPPYREYIDWLARQDKDAARAYWSRRLEGFERITCVPPLPGGAGAGEHVLVLDEKETQELRDRAASMNVTLNTLVQGAWARVLARCNDTGDVAFGAIVAGRPSELEGVERMVGLFINAVPVRVRVDDDEPFASLVRRMQLDAAESTQHQHLSLAEIGRDVFDHVLVFDNYPEEEGKGMEVRQVAAHDRTHYPFSLVIVPARKLHVRFLYDRARYADEHVKRIGELWSAATQVAAFPRRGADAAPMERKRRLRSPHSKTVFAPSRIDPLASSLAAAVHPHKRVAILLPRSDDAVAAILGVLRAGAAYVPIDPGYPQSRIDWMIRDSECTLVIDEAFLGNAPRDREAPRVDIEPDDLAYILYTSGSTGMPKGVLVEHRNLAHYLGWAAREYGPGSYPLFTSLSFDLTVTSLFLPLMHGRQQVVFPHDVEPRDALEAIFSGRAGVDCVKLTPSHVTLLEELDIARSPIRLAIVGGEALTQRHVQTLHRLNPSMRVINEYGPTEATVGCMVKECRDDEPVTIGVPIDGTRIHILDRKRRPMPLGIPGEIWIDGPGVARGYQSGGSGGFVEGMYRTGDLGRLLPNGEYEYLGRNDDQLKVRGHRVEPREIEAAIEALDGVRRAVLLARDGNLVAWVEGRAVQRGELDLPEWMLPARIHEVETMPLTTNGKLDKAKLISGEAGFSPPDEFAGGLKPASPPDDVEAQILLIWQNVLGDVPLGVDDNFFDRGGHSLKAMQVVARIHRKLGVRIALRDFLAEPTIAATAKLVRDSRPSPYAAIEPVPPREHYELSHAQQRLWLLHRMKGAVAYNMPKAFVAEGPLDVDALRRAFGALVARHEALRTAFVVIGGEPRQVVHENVTAVVRELDVRDDDEARAIAAREAATPFDLEKPPLLRVTVLHLAPAKHVILLTLHHIAGDGWSLNVLYREILALMNGAALPPLRIQYKDFAAWQNAADVSRDETYWTDRLRGMPESLRLPYDFAPAEEERDFCGSTERIYLPSRNINELARRSGTTAASAMLACFAHVLHAISRQDDFCIGVSVANRNDRDLESLIGFFVNILPIRVQTSADMTEGELLQSVARAAVEAFDHQDYPFDRLVRAINPARTANRQPLLNVTYGFQNYADVRVDVVPHAGDDVFTEFPISVQTSKFDLCLFVSDLGEELLLDLEYDTGLFAPATIRRILRALERCALTFDANRPLGEVVFEAANETDFNDTRTDYPRNATVHELFARVAHATPDAKAVIFENESLTYAELEQRANAIARFLREQGTAREELVGVMLDRSIDLVPALLGILEAGAAYVPISGDLPYERVRWILDDTGARMLITEKRYVGAANRLQWDCPALRAFLCVDSDDVHAEPEESGGIMAPEIWDYVAREAFDDISGGGWKSSYTGEWLSREVMDEYGENIRGKLEPLLTPRSRVLEIGCASGISMFRLAPLVARYYGTDLSPGIVRWSEDEAKRRGIESIRLAPLAAHEIDQLDERGFDVVILNSVIECFTGHNYLRDVLRKAIALMNDGGFLFLGNVWDQDLKPRFIESLLDFRRCNPEAGKRAKIDRAEELFLSRTFIEDLRGEFPEIADIEYSTMLGSAESELSQFGFDALVRIEKGKAGIARTPSRRQFDRRDLRSAAVPAAECAAGSAAGGGTPLAQPARTPAFHNSLAYLMYTSGTSGKPKGVMIEHRSIVRLVCNTDYLALGPGDRTLQAGALGFDASTLEIWGPLLNGGCVVLPRGKSFLHAADLGRLIREHAVTVLFLTTGLFNQIVDDDVSVFAGLRVLLTGGEKVSVQHMNRVLETHPTLALKHVYGPTENTTFSTCYDVTRRHERDVPIGRPIANSTAYVLDERLRQVPLGMPGELCVGGDGLSRGYLHDAELTRRKFIEWNGRRLYRTGDLVRQARDGNIEFIGRTDTQVKIRGFRIELEEIEAHLLGHASVGGAAVIAHGSGDAKTLVAYVSGSVDADALRASMRAALPEVMVPSHFVTMEKLPLNASGKVDRKALPPPDLGTVRADAVAPATSLERKLAEIWERVLARPNAGVTDDFFEHGGHSLKVTKLVSAIQKEIGVEVPLTVVFRAPTIRELAHYIEDAQRFDLRLLDDTVVALNRAEGSPKIFAFPPGSGTCLSYLRLAEIIPLPFYGFGFVDDVGEYVRRIREIDAEGPYVLFGYSSGGKLAFRVAQELECAGACVSDVVLLDSARYLRRVQFTEREIREVAAEFLESVTSRVLREKALARMRRYRQFIGQSVESGSVRANLHLIAAEDSQELLPVATLAGWSELTTGRFTRTAGSGAHRAMLQPPHLERNVELLWTIMRSSSMVTA